MAKKNVPLPKPKGTDGNGNISLPGGPKVLDLGDFDDIFGPLDSDSPKQGPLGEFYKGLKDSFSDRFKTKDIVRNFLRSAAPDGISNAMGFADEALSATRDIAESLERSNPGDLQYIAKRAQAILPQIKDLVPDEAYNNISQGLENKIDEYDYTIQSNRDQTAIRRANQDQSDDNLVKSALDNIALTEKVNHNRSERAANTRHATDRAENSIRDVLKTKRFDYMARSMGMAVDGIQRMAGYQEQVNYNFQRKGLELQFRTFLGIKELVKLSEAQIELNARAFNAIVRNTGLADHVKSGAQGITEIGRDTNNRGFMSKLAGKVAPKTLSHFLGNFGSEVQSRATSNLGQKLAMGVAAMRMGEQGPSLWDNKYSMAGQFAGDYASDFVMNDLIPMLGREARPGLTKLSNKKGGRHNQIGYHLDNLPAFLQEFVNNGQNQHGIKGTIKDILSPMLPQFGLNDRLQNGTFQTIDQHAAFNQATQRSIVDGIPGYLARLLQEVRMIRTGSNDVGREVYDNVSGKFTLESSSHEAILNKVIPKSAIRAASTTINDSLNTIDSDGTLSPEARKALSERMLRDSSHNRRFDPEAYVKGRGYANGTSPEVAAELESFFKNKFEFDDKGSMKDTSDNHQLRQEFSQAFLDIRSISRDPIKEINRLVNSGHTEPLRAMGIITVEDGIDKINYPRIWDILRSGVTGDNPFAPGGSGQDPYRDDMSGTAGHKDFMGPVHPGMGTAFVRAKVNTARKKYAPEEQAARDAMAKHLKTMRGRFGAAAEHVQGTMADAQNHPEGIQGFAKDSYSKMMSGQYGNPMQGMAQHAKPGFDKFVGNVQDAIGAAKSKISDSSDEVITDLYTKFDRVMPILRAGDLARGDLIDVNTKKIITKLSDITGKVINTAGETIITANEVAAGLMNPNGDTVLKIAKNAGKAISDAIAKNMPTFGNKSDTGAIDTSDPDDPEGTKEQDWSLGPGEDPVITSRGLNSGEYMDKAGKVINSLSDIAGDVYDRSGNLVMSAKEFLGGLWSKRTGSRYRPTKNFNRLMKFARWGGKLAGSNATTLTLGAMKFTAKAALGIASKALNFFVDNQNAYLPGEENPVITRRAVQNGEYFDDKGKPVEDFLDVYSPLYNAQGELVIEPAEYKNLKNWDGSKHVLAKNKSIIAKLIKRPMRFLKNQYMKATKKYYGWLGRTTVKAGSWLGRKTLGGFAKIGGNVFNRMFDKVEDPNVQAQISATMAASEASQHGFATLVEAINSLKPEKLRKGSWQAKEAEKAANGGLGGKGKPGEEDGKDGLLKRGLKGLAGMLGLGKKKGKEEEEDDGFGLDDAADVADIADSVRGRRGGGEVGKKAGRLSRWGKSIADSKVGKWVGGMGGKFMQTGVGKWLGGKVGQTVAGVAGSAVVSSAMSYAAPLVAGAMSVPLGVAAGIGAAAVTVVGGSAWLYSRWSDAHGDLRSLRMEQYGLFNTSDRLKTIKLEALLEKYTDKEAEVPSFSLSGAGAKEILNTMDIDLEDKSTVMIFAGWLEKRFKPIYAAWISGLKKIGKTDISLDEVDDKVPNELKADLIESVKFPYNSSSPYAVTENPFDPDSPLEDNMAKISSMFDELLAKYAPDRKKKDDQDKSVVKAPGDDASKTSDAAKAGAVGAAAATGNAALSLAKANGDETTKGADVMNSPLAAKAAAAGSMSGTIANLNQRIGNTLTGLQAIRMRAYGLQVLNLADVRSLLALEAVYAKDLTTADDVVDYNGDEGQLLVEAGKILGKDTAVGSDDRIKLYNWLTQRFAPAFRAYYGMAKSLNPSADLKSLESKLKGADKVTVGQAILGAIYRHDTTVWEVPSIFPVDGPLSDLKKLADADLNHLKEEAEKEVVDSPTQKGSDQMAGKNAAQTGGSFTDKVIGTIKDTWANTKETVSTAWNNAKEATGEAYASAKISIGMGPDYGEGGAQGGTIQSAGEKGNVVAGNGGQWESIPYPSASGSIKAAYPTMAAVAKMTGVPVDWLLAICGLESGFRYTVKAGTSSASGWFQFIDGTWDMMINKYGSKYGLPADPGRKLRNDPRVNALMGAEFTKMNYEILKKGLGRDDLTDTDVYMAHFLGAGGALKFFRADPNAMGYKIFQKEYSSNMPLFFVDSKPSQPRTIAQIYKLFQDKIAKFWASAGKGYKQGGEEASQEPAPQTPGAVANDQAVADEAAKANMQADAKDPDGVAAQAKDAGGSGDAATTDAGGSGSPSVTALARGTAPMPGAPATGGGSSSSTTATGTDSGAGVVDSRQQSQLDAAQAQNSRRVSEVKRDQQATSDATEVQTKQLNTLFEIRDLMKQLVDSSNAKASGIGQSTSSTGGSSGNNMNQSTMSSRPSAERPSSLTLR